MARHPTNRYGPFYSQRCRESPPALLRQGVAEFNRRAYFIQHETLEALWRAETDDVRYLYQGILLVGVGLLHLQRFNYRGTTSKLKTGLRLLQWFEPVCQGVAVSRLMAGAQRTLDAINVIGPDRLAEFDWATAPQIDIVEDTEKTGVC